MNKADAREIAEKDLEFYRVMSYEEIAAKLGEQDSYERVTAKREPYQIEFEFFYDDVKTKNLRVMATVSFSGWTDFFPVSNDFIMAPNGSFVGE